MDKLEPIGTKSPGYTNVNNLENIEFDTILTRIRQKYRMRKFIQIDQTKSSLFLSDPLISKLYTLIHNILQRCDLKQYHDTYLIDLRPQATVIDEAFKMQPDHEIGGKCVFNVGLHTGGNLNLDYPIFDEHEDGRPTNMLRRRVNICQNVYPLMRPARRTESKGSCFTILTLNQFNDPTSHEEIIKKANSFAPNTIVKEGNIARFFDPQFTIDKLRLSRSAYLGHLESGNQKGKKIYSANRPLPTLGRT